MASLRGASVPRLVALGFLVLLPACERSDKGADRTAGTARGASAPRGVDQRPRSGAGSPDVEPVAGSHRSRQPREIVRRRLRRHRQGGGGQQRRPGRQRGQPKPGPAQGRAGGWPVADRAVPGRTLHQRVTCGGLRREPLGNPSYSHPCGRPGATSATLSDPGPGSRRPEVAGCEPGSPRNQAGTG